MALTTNLLAYWKLDETSGTSAADATGNGHTGTLQSNASFVSTGKINYGLTAGSSSSGTGGGFDVGLDAGLDFTSYPLSYSVWFKTSTNNTTGNGGMMLVSIQKPSSNYSSCVLQMIMDGSANNGKLYADYRNSGGTDYFIQTTSTYNDGNWHHAVLTISSGGVMKLYVDNTLVASGATASGNLFTGTKRTTIGGNWDHGMEWQGTMDEVAIWSRELDTTDIASLYNSGSGSQYPFSTSVTVSPSVLAATFSIPAATVTAIQNVTVSPSVLAATFSTQAPTETGGATVSPAVLAATFSIPLPNIITPDALINASVLSATFSVPARTVSAGALTTPSVLSATFSQPSATFRGDFTALPSALSATFSIPAPTISAIGNITVSPSVLAATFSLPTRTVSAEQNASIAAGVLSATFSLQTPTVTAIRNVELTATTLIATFSVNTPRKVGGLWTAQPREQGVWTPQPRAI